MASLSKIKKYVTGLLTLLEDTPLDKIRVKDICDICGTDRQNFYYYFNDKYELASWIFKLDIIESKQKFNDMFGPDQMADLLRKMWDKRKVYTELLADNSQNFLLSYLSDNRKDLYYTLLNDHYKIYDVNDDQDLKITFAFHGATQSIKSWLKGEFVMTPEEYAYMLYELLPFKNNPLPSSQKAKDEPDIKR